MNRPIPLFVLAAAIATGGCASFRQTMDGWFGEESATPPAPTPLVGDPYFAASDHLPVFAEASTASEVVGHLALHEKVIRTRLERGYAHVTAERGGLSGWVNNAQLVWRLPAARAPDVDSSQQPRGAAGEAARSEDQQALTPGAAGTGMPGVEPTATAISDTAPVAATATSIPPPQDVAPTATVRPRPQPSMFDPY